MYLLNITEGLTFNERHRKDQVHQYEPQFGVQLYNIGAEIWINLKTQGRFLHPTESYLLIEGWLQKNDDAVYSNVDFFALIHNGIMRLLKCIIYRLPGQYIVHINDPSVATIMLTYPDDFY